MSNSESALLRAYPALRERLPRWPCLAGPTPVEALNLAGLPAGSLFVKRDERSCDDYGGNKPRKLEFVLGAALARGAKRLVTTGGLGTNHGLATTILARRVGLATTLVLVRQPISDGVVRTLLACNAWGARLRYGAGVPGAAAAVLGELARAAARGERPQLIATGGSSTRGIVGLVAAGLELADQVREGRIPEPARIYVPVGSGGTLAGLVAGLKLAGLASRVVGVLVTDILPPSPRRLVRAARAVLRSLQRADPGVPAVDLQTGDFDLVRDQLGPGYGSTTPAADAAVAAAAERGLSLETTYTGKCLAAILERERGGSEPTLFWNTFNAVDVESHAPGPLDVKSLPRSFQRLLERRGPGLSA